MKCLTINRGRVFVCVYVSVCVCLCLRVFVCFCEMRGGKAEDTKSCIDWVPRWGSRSPERKMGRTEKLQMEYRNVGRDEDRQLFAYLSNDRVVAVWEIFNTSVNVSEPPGDKV